MYSKEEAKKLKQEFWTAYGQYMALTPSADGERVNWVNYKTGIKHLYFRMDATNKAVTIAVEMTHPDAGIRQLMYNQFLELKNVLHDTLEEEWIWDEVFYDEDGRKIARIWTSREKLSIFNKEHWPEIISFLKPRIVALDEFWSMAKYSFEIFK